MKRRMASLAAIGAVGAVGFVTAVSIAGAGTSVSTDNDHGTKVFVCKYVGTPGVDERLQTGDNPIDVSINAIPDYHGVGSWFADAHGRSFVLGPEHRANEHVDEPPVSACPAPSGPAKLTVTKVVVNDDGGTATVSDFPLFVSGAPVTSGAQTELAAGTYTVSETGKPGYTATIGGDCAADGSITLAPNDVRACTITNDDVGEQEEEPATLRVVKIVVGGSKTPGDFTIDVSGVKANPSSFHGSSEGTSVTLGAGAYSVTEPSHPGYDVTYSAGCSGTIAAGGSATCTVTNTARSEPPPSGPECPPGTVPGGGKDGEEGNDNCVPVRTEPGTTTTVTPTEPTPTETTPTETFEPPTLPEQPTTKPAKPKPAAKKKPAAAAKAARAPYLPPTLAYTP
jgi:hypothetical protein